jgi:metal-dependent amidase/aminoacylase/carboxypeptidase family protein
MLIFRNIALYGFIGSRRASTLESDLHLRLLVILGDYRLRFEIGYPPMINDPEVVDRIRVVANQLLGASHVHTPKMEMGAEDFSYMTALAHGAMFQLGCARPGEDRKLHSSIFDIDEDCLPVGVAVMSQTALTYLTRSAGEPGIS